MHIFGSYYCQFFTAPLFVKKSFSIFQYVYMYMYATHTSEKFHRFSVCIIIIFAPDRKWQQSVETEKILKFKFVF